MSLKSVVGKTCIWCIVVATAALSLLAIIWMVIVPSGNQQHPGNPPATLRECD